MSVGNLYPFIRIYPSKLVAFGMDKQGTYGVWLQIMSWSAFVLNKESKVYWIFDGRSISIGNRKDLR